MVLHGDGSQAMNINTLALSRKPLPEHADLFHWAPDLCGDQVVQQLSGLTYADFLSLRGRD